MSDNKIIAKMEGIKYKFEELGRQIIDPDIMADMKKFISINKEYRSLEPVVAAFDKYKLIVANIESAKKLLEIEKDDEMCEMAFAEIENLEMQQTSLEEEIKLLLIPKDPQDDRNANL
jgi:peptide chain release factor 1